MWFCAFIQIIANGLSGADMRRKQTADICNEFPDNDKNMLLNEIQG